MRDGQCYIILSHTSQNKAVTYYHLELAFQGDIFTCCYRYSKLRTFADMLPKVEEGFPGPRHIGKFVSSIVGSEGFLEERKTCLRRFFQSVSRQQQLQESSGFKKMLEEAERRVEVEPRAPVMRGRKLESREVVGQLLLAL